MKKDLVRHLAAAGILAATLAMSSNAAGQGFSPGDHAIFDPFSYGSLGTGDLSGTAFTYVTGVTPTLTNGTTTYTGFYETAGGRSFAIFSFDTIDISTDITVTNGGNSAGLVFLSRGGILLTDATINLNGTNGASDSGGLTVTNPGGISPAGGGDGGAGISSAGAASAFAGSGPAPGLGATSMSGSSSQSPMGGGGGANGGDATAGSARNASFGTPGPGGLALATDALKFQDASTDSLAGGSGGGGAARGGNLGRAGGGGAGGGFLQLVAIDDISISGAVSFLANGGAGGENSSNGFAGGGGGSGGTIVLATTQNLSLAGGATLGLNVNGGNGGRAGIGSGSFINNGAGGKGSGGRVGIFASGVGTDDLQNTGSYTGISGVTISLTPGTQGAPGAAGVGSVYLDNAIAVPEPSTVAVAFGLLAGVLAFRRRRSA